MQTTHFKRGLSLVLAFVMVFSMMPLQAFAEETDGHDHAEETADVALLAEEPAEHEHSYEETVIAPDCGNGGYTLYTCQCGDSYTADETEATGLHTYTAEVVAPTAEAEGYTRHTCTVCGDTYTDNVVEKLPQSTEAETQPQMDATEDNAEEENGISGIISDMQTVLDICGITPASTDEEMLDA